MKCTTTTNQNFLMAKKFMPAENEVEEVEVLHMKNDPARPPSRTRQILVNCGR
jgi:hypothetical protein